MSQHKQALHGTEPARPVSQETARLLNAHAAERGFQIVLEGNGDPEGAARRLTVCRPAGTASSRPETVPLTEVPWALDFLLEVVTAQHAELRRFRAEETAQKADQRLAAALRQLAAEGSPEAAPLLLQVAVHAEQGKLLAAGVERSLTLLGWPVLSRRLADRLTQMGAGEERA